MRIRIFHNGTLVDDTIASYRRTFGEVPIGQPLVYVNSLLNLAVAINQGSYAASHKVESGPDWSLNLGLGRRVACAERASVDLGPAQGQFDFFN